MSERIFLAVMNLLAGIACTGQAGIAFADRRWGWFLAQGALGALCGLMFVATCRRWGPKARGA